MRATMSWAPCLLRRIPTTISGSPFTSMDICVKNEKIANFYFNLRTLNELVEVPGRDQLPQG